MDPMNMVDELLPTEADLRYFCKQNGLQSSSIAIMAIEAYKALYDIIYISSVFCLVK